MPDQGFNMVAADAQVNISQLSLVRWIALSGQLAAILFVYFILSYPLPLITCLVLVAASALVGFWQAVATADSKQFSRRAVLLLLSFDIVQLGVLLYLTGGLANPFSVMLLAPVTISATVLRQQETATLVVLTMVVATVLAFYHFPLPWASIFSLEPLYVAGLWFALVLTTVFVALYAGLVSSESRKLARGLAEARLSLEREHKMVSLGSLATAAAHKLGSPLNTITIIAHELEHLADGKTNSKQYQHFIDDIRQLKEETERCRAILAELNDDAVLLGNESTDPVTISAFLKSLMEERFADIITMLSMEVNANEAIAEPMVTRRPELIHPIETLVDNAAHFTETSIGLGLSWDEMNFTITIRDDGPGFQSSVLASLGDPYASSREGVDGHMGLGVFIAMTMVNHVGGSIKIGNRKTGGAEAILTYPREGFDAGP